ncbi:MAG: heparin lyase I family protein [Oceanospirillaceae bacterium]|nr:heparin lyase I family protein [Oceanospirillaceae bacterium]
MVRLVLTLLLPIFFIVGCQTTGGSGRNYDYNKDNSRLVFPENKAHPYAKFYRNSDTEFDQIFVAKNEIDRHITLKPLDRELYFEKNSKQKKLSHSLAAREVIGFPDYEESEVWRFETKWGWCIQYDCTDEAVNIKNSRSEITPHTGKLGKSYRYSFAFYIPTEGNILDGTENLHITQLKGGSEEIPIWIGIAPYKRVPKREEQPLLRTERTPDENGLTITKQIVRQSVPWEFSPWGSGIRQVDEDIETGDLVVFFRSILGIKDHIGRYMYKLADADDIKGRWHEVEVDVKWSRSPLGGRLKYIFDGKTIVDCNPCQTAPDHQFSHVSTHSGEYAFKMGAYRWINSNVMKDGGTYNHKPRDVVIYYKGFKVEASDAY